MNILNQLTMYTLNNTNTSLDKVTVKEENNLDGKNLKNVNENGSNEKDGSNENGSIANENGGGVVNDPIEIVSKSITSFFENIFVKGLNNINNTGLNNIKTDNNIKEENNNTEEKEKHLSKFNNFKKSNEKKKKHIKRKKINREEKIIANTNTWLNDVLPNWKKKRHSYHIKSLCWDGIPPKIREKVWRRAIGNRLKITKEIYNNMINNVEKIKKDTNQQNNESTVHLIQLDLLRTFPALAFFAEGSPMHNNLKNILEAYVSYCPEMGYVQGMSYIVAMLLLNMDEYHAFVAICNLLNLDLLKSFYSIDLEKMEKFFGVFDKAIAQFLPILHKHLKLLEITPNLYCLDWILTLYSKSLPINVATRVWDILLFEGEHSLIHIALGILSLVEKKLLKGDFETCLQILQHISDEDHDEVKFILTTRNIYFSKQKYLELINNDM